MEAPNADVVIEEIDADRVPFMMLTVVRALHRHMLLHDPLQINVLAAYDRGDQPVDMLSLQNEIWDRMKSLDPASQSGLRLTNCLTRSDAKIDWELGEYLIFWARQQGLSETQIIAAFGAGTTSLPIS